MTDRHSFENIKEWLLLIKDNLKDLNEPRLILFGNKDDIKKEKWQVISEEAKEFANQNNLFYFETSAKTKQGINEGFSYIIEEIYYSLKGKKTNKNC